MSFDIEETIHVWDQKETSSEPDRVPFPSRALIFCHDRQKNSVWFLWTWNFIFYFVRQWLGEDSSEIFVDSETGITQDTAGIYCRSLTVFCLWTTYPKVLIS